MTSDKIGLKYRRCKAYCLWVQVTTHKYSFDWHPFTSGALTLHRYDTCTAIQGTCIIMRCYIAASLPSSKISERLFGKVDVGMQQLDVHISVLAPDEQSEAVHVNGSLAARRSWFAGMVLISVLICFSNSLLKIRTASSSRCMDIKKLCETSEQLNKNLQNSSYGDVISVCTEAEPLRYRIKGRANIVSTEFFVAWNHGRIYFRLREIADRTKSICPTCSGNGNM